MSSTFIRRIFQEELDAIEAEAQRREAEARRREAEARRREAESQARLLAQLQRTVEDTVALRFPGMPIGFVLGLRGVGDAEELHALHRALLQAADQAEAERALARLGER